MDDQNEFKSAYCYGCRHEMLQDFLNRRNKPVGLLQHTVLYERLNLRKMFLTPRQVSYRQPSDGWWDAPAIETPRLKLRAKVTNACWLSAEAVAPMYIFVTLVRHLSVAVTGMTYSQK